MNPNQPLSPAQRDLLARIEPRALTAIRQCSIAIDPLPAAESRQPLYGMIAPAGDRFTLVFQPSAARGREKITGHSGRIFAAFAGTEIPIIDFRTAHGPRPLDGVQEEYGEQNVYVKPPTLAEYCELARKAGATVWALSRDNFRRVAETGFPAGVDREAAHCAMEKSWFEEHATPAPR